MKCVIVERPVKDVDGVLTSLRSNMETSVVTVGSDPRRTYVYLQDAAQEDPSEHVMGWKDRPELLAVLDGPPPVADGMSKARLVLSYAEPFTGEIQPRRFKVQVKSSHGLMLSAKKLSLKKGRVTVEVGPAIAPLEDLVEFWDPWGRIPTLRITVPFVAPPPPNPDDEETEYVPRVEKPSVWRVFRRLWFKR